MTLLQSATTAAVTEGALPGGRQQGFDHPSALDGFRQRSERLPGSARWPLARLGKPGLWLLAVVVTSEGTSACRLKPSSPAGFKPAFSTDFKWSRGSLLPVKIEPPNTLVSPCLKQGGEYFEMSG